ncbi:Fungalysin metallopeptidase-domain-containing protein [Syncephalis fuscata]|nr:Fungalysin metallopeptidase-domain-containing protein [Syncephalis fuscata]
MHIDLRIASLILAFVAAVSCANQRIEVDSIIPKINVDSAVRTLSPNLGSYKPPASFTPHNAQEVALEFARSQLHIKDGDFVVTTSHKSKLSGTTHVYLQQTIKALKSPMVSWVFMSTKQTRSLPMTTASSRPTQLTSCRCFEYTCHTHQQQFDASKVQVVPQAKSTGGGQSYLLKNVGFTKSAVKASQSYIQTSANEVEPAWEFTVKLPLNYFSAHVSADGTKILALSDLISFASYSVVKFGNNNPIDTPLQTVTNPADKTASPNGWHTQGSKQFTTTVGNNVFAQANYEVEDYDYDMIDDDESKWKNSTRPDGGKNLKFDFAYDAKKAPKDNINAAVTNLFYITNIMHDLFYQYGFNEAAGNFQENNGDKGGKGGDAVAAQALQGYDFPGYRGNAFFLPTLDGERPTMAMFGFDNVSPGRDGDFENDIISHEYGHGVSNRLTGGSKNALCLRAQESRGMGEGWSDFFAYWIEMKALDKFTKNVEMGKYVVGKNIRHHPYSTDITANPKTYDYLNQPEWGGEVHNIGEIWATMLYEGNTLLMQIIIDGLKLQPCNPTFLQARDAIIQAEQQLTGGKHACEIWRGFAKRGLGYKAASKDLTKTADTSLPSNCKA